MGHAEGTIDGLVRRVASSELTPISFLERAGDVWTERPAVREGNRRWTYGQHLDRVRRAAGALQQLGVGAGGRVATLLPNVAAMLELHYAVPGAGAVLVPLNTRLSAAEYAYVLDHAGAEIVVAHDSLRPVVDDAISRLRGSRPQLVWVGGAPQREIDYEELLSAATASDLRRPAGERDLLSINYTSGTTGRPKGVMASHRGAYLHSLGVIAESGLDSRSVYLWTLPMFHCNGWAYTWAVTATGATHVCLPVLDPERLWGELDDEMVTHLCAAPTVLSMLLTAERAHRLQRRLRVFVGGAPPAPSLLARAEALNVDVTHLYGLTETYGPLVVCAWNPDWDRLPRERQSRLRARQGVATIVTEPIRVVDEQLRDVPRDGETMGEVVMRGNNVTPGYYRNPEATREAFRGGWFHSGDLAVMHPDGYVELRDRLKDIVISGGENISTIEVEQVLCDHPEVDDAAVVGAPDDHWGEVCVAFVRAEEGAARDAAALRDFARERLARFKVPKRIEFVDELPKTATGKIQKHLLRERVLSEERSGRVGGDG